jgi:hypothetical protein
MMKITISADEEGKEDIARPPSHSVKEHTGSSTAKPPEPDPSKKPKKDPSPRWHISSTFFNAENNPLFYNYDPDRPQNSNFTENDQHLLTYLEGIKTTHYFPGYFCWIEKIVLLIDFLQVFALIWILSQPYPWPYLWSIYTQPINVFNLDFFSLTFEGALAGSTGKLISPWGQMSNYLSSYGIFYAGVSLALTIGLYCLFHHRKFFDSYGQALFHYYPHFFSVLLFLSYLLFVPCTLATLRVYYCDSHNSNSLLAVDPTITCLSSSHLMYIFIYSICILPFIVSIFYYFYYYTERNIIYYNNIDHEKKLQVYELLYMFQINSDYINKQVWVISSFRYFSRYYYSHMLLLKLFLVVNFIFNRDSYLFQSFLAFLAICVFSFYYTIYKLPYRNLNTNLQFTCVVCLWIINISYSACNSSQMVNVMTQASTETLFLIASHVLFFMVIVGLNCYILFYKTIKLDWPSIRTLDRIYHAPTLIPKVYYWLILLKQIEKIKIQYLIDCAEINNVQLIEFIIQQLRIYFLQAKSVGSIFENILQDYLEELLWIHSQRAIFSLRQSSYWNNAYENLVQSKVLKHRHEKYLLMNPVKKRILLKLLSYFVIRGEDRYAKKFDLNVALEYQQNLRLQRELKLQRLKDIYHQKQLKHQVNKFSHFASDFQTLMDPDDIDGTNGGKSTHRTKYGEEIDEDNEEPDKFDPEVIAEAKKMIDRLQQRTELALNKHHHAAKAIQDQQKQLSLQNKLNNNQIYNETSQNQKVNNIIHQFNEAHHHQQQEQLSPKGSSQNLRKGFGSHQKIDDTVGKMNNMSQYTKFGGSTQSMIPGQQQLNKISTMDLIKETVDEEERQDLEELYYLWDEAITLYESEEFPGDYQDLNQQVENWYAYRGLVSKRLEVIVKFLQDQIEMLDDLIDEQVEEEEYDEEDDEGDKLERGRLNSNNQSFENQNRKPVDFDENDIYEGSSSLMDRPNYSRPVKKTLSKYSNNLIGSNSSFNRSFNRQVPEEDEDYDDEENNYGRLVDEDDYVIRKKN